jgi:diguanylate cyclase (GGDEF)-like protein
MPVKKASAAPSLGSARVVQAALREDCSIEQLGSLAATDPALTIKVLALVNSPAFGVKAHVTDVKQGISLIGARGLRTLALSLIVSELLPDQADANLLLVQCLRRAEACRGLAQAMRLTQADACFSTGLLLELAVLWRAREDLTATLRSAHQSSEHRILFEEAEGVRSHCRLGAELAASFGLPADTVNAILHHHDPEPPEDPMARAAWAAERLAGAFESTRVGVARERAIAAAGLVGVKPEDALLILEQLPVRVGQLGGAFQRELGPQPNLDKLRDDANARMVEMTMQYEQTIRALEMVLKEKDALAARLERVNRELEQLATTDALTGLSNRRAMMTALDRDLARAERDHTKLGFVILDVDHFKRFNDEHGHPLGDEVLRCVGKVLAAGARKGDLPARYGGEEFCVILPGADVEAAALVARRLRIAIERLTIESPKGTLHVTASFGVSAFAGQSGVTSQSLIKSADQALYRAKAEGRNRVVAAA